MKRSINFWNENLIITKSYLLSGIHKWLSEVDEKTMISNPGEQYFLSKI